MRHGKGDKPEMALGSDGQVLKHKPDTNSIISIRQAERTGSKTTDQVPGKHALWLGWVMRLSKLLLLLLDLLPWLTVIFGLWW